MGGHGQMWVCPFRSQDSAVSQEWMNEVSWDFAYSYMVSGKLKVTLGMHMVKYGCDLLGLETLKSALSQLKDKSMNWADFLHDRSDGIMFDQNVCYVSLAFKF